MPFDRYFLPRHEKKMEKPKPHDGFSVDSLYAEDISLIYPLAGRARGTVIDIHSELFDWLQSKQVPRRYLFAPAIPESLEEEQRLDIVKILKNSMKLNRTDAETLANKLFEELDQIARERNAERFSQDEKEQLVLAITKTAKNVVKALLKK